MLEHSWKKGSKSAHCRVAFYFGTPLTRFCSWFRILSINWRESTYQDSGHEYKNLPSRLQQSWAYHLRWQRNPFLVLQRFSWSSAAGPRKLEEKSMSLRGWFESIEVLLELLECLKDYKALQSLPARKIVTRFLSSGHFGSAFPQTYFAQVHMWKKRSFWDRPAGITLPTSTFCSHFQKKSFTRWKVLTLVHSTVGQTLKSNYF